MYIAGIDIGASDTKAVIIDRHKTILGAQVIKTGVDLELVFRRVYRAVLGKAGLKEKQVKHIVATGFGRYNAPCANHTVTEITCHAVGAHHYFTNPITVIDIGGQDNKIIRVDAEGKVVDFRMNRKCAAGTGAFIKEIAYKMDIPLWKLNQLAKQSTKELALGSYCTVFTATEILSKIREGEKKEDIIRGIFLSVAKRITEMGLLEGKIVLTGGVIAYNDILLEILGSLINKKILVPPRPQLIGALGAALIGLQNKERKTDI